MEMWDLFDEKRRPLFRTHQRGKMKHPGEYHVVVEIWTVDSGRNILLTLRDPNKEVYPNKWEVTTGSALAGETSRQAAVRELREETGILAAEEELLFLASYREPSAFVDTYLLRRDIAATQLALQEGETVGAQWVSLERLDEMIEDKSISLSVERWLAAVKSRFLEQLGL